MTNVSYFYCSRCGNWYQPDGAHQCNDSVDQAEALDEFTLELNRTRLYGLLERIAVALERLADNDKHAE